MIVSISLSTAVQSPKILMIFIQSILAKFTKGQYQTGAPRYPKKHVT